jgi:hypothetical protein
MTRLPSGDSLGVVGASVPDPLGFGVSDGGGADLDLLGLRFGGASYKVSDGSWVMFGSMVLYSPSSCCCWSETI